jgi:hypothetical protein
MMWEAWAMRVGRVVCRMVKRVMGDRFLRRSRKIVRVSDIFYGVEFTMRWLSGVGVTVNSGGRSSPFPSIRLDGVRDNGGECVGRAVEKALPRMGSRDGDVGRRRVVDGDMDRFVESVDDALRKGKFRRRYEGRGYERRIDEGDGGQGKRKGKRDVFSKDVVRRDWRYYIFT